MRRPTRSAPKPAPPPERDIAAAIVEAFALCGVRLERQNTGVGFYPEKGGGTRRVRFGKAGNLDWRATLPDGRTLEVEIKRPGKKPTAAQLGRMREINASNGVAFWAVDPADILRVVPPILAGARVVEGEPGVFYVTDEPKGARNP